MRKENQLTSVRVFYLIAKEWAWTIFDHIDSKKGTLWPAKGTFENRLQFHRSNQCKQINVLHQGKVYFARALFLRQTWYKSYFIYCYISAVRSTKTKLWRSMKHILPQSKLFTMVLVQQSASRIFAFKRANPIGIAGSKMWGSISMLLLICLLTLAGSDFIGIWKPAVGAKI